jgi:hypothetical protein
MDYLELLGKQWLFNRVSNVCRLKERRWIEAAEIAWQVASAAGIKGFTSCSAMQKLETQTRAGFSLLIERRRFWKPGNGGDVRR